MYIYTAVIVFYIMVLLSYLHCYAMSYFFMYRNKICKTNKKPYFAHKEPKENLIECRTPAQQRLS